MDKIFRKDVSAKKVFKRANATYYQVYADSDNQLYIYDIMREGEHRGYEIIKTQKHINPDGSIIHILPSDEEFGSYGWTTIGTENTYDREIENIISIAKEKILKNASI